MVLLLDTIWRRKRLRLQVLSPKLRPTKVTRRTCARLSPQKFLRRREEESYPLPRAWRKRWKALQRALGRKERGGISELSKLCNAIPREDLPAVIAAVRRFPEKGKKEMLLETLFANWAEVDPLAAIASSQSEGKQTLDAV